MNPDDPLLKILACPLDKGPLVLLEPEEQVLDNVGEARDVTPAAGPGPGPASAAATPEQALYNPRLRRRYPIVDGIPQLLPSSGEQVPEDEHERLLKRISS
ncbi:Trm112 family protein [Streptomyces aureocirculatus]|uniref:Trm112 family protein n=1 Tax=Streptomyces aureocirculatus TaxID=67275 RepID=UPI0004C4A31B|nr:Trm112 family protein [Streptomyces aureocirculatus]